MALITKQNLSFEYSWTAFAHDNPKVTGNPDRALLNRAEGYEVLDFINRFASTYNLKKKSSGLKLERLMQQCPSNIRSHVKINKWILNNWKLQEEGQTPIMPGLGILDSTYLNQQPKAPIRTGSGITGRASVQPKPLIK